MSFRTPSESRHLLAMMSARADCRTSTYALVGGLAEAVLVENTGKRLVMVTERDSRTHYLEPGEKVELVFTPDLKIVALNNGLSKE